MIERTFRVGDIVTIKGKGEYLLVENCGVRWVTTNLYARIVDEVLP